MPFAISELSALSTFVANMPNCSVWIFSGKTLLSFDANFNTRCSLYLIPIVNINNISNYAKKNLFKCLYFFQWSVWFLLLVKIRRKVFQSFELWRIFQSFQHMQLGRKTGPIVLPEISVHDRFVPMTLLK